MIVEKFLQDKNNFEKYLSRPLIVYEETGKDWFGNPVIQRIHTYVGEENFINKLKEYCGKGNFFIFDASHMHPHNVLPKLHLYPNCRSLAWNRM